MRFNDQEVKFNIAKVMKYPAIEKDNECFRMEVAEYFSNEQFKKEFDDKFKQGEIFENEDEVKEEDLDYIQGKFKTFDLLENDSKNLIPSSTL